MTDALYELEMARAELDEARHANAPSDFIALLEQEVADWERQVLDDIDDETIDSFVLS